MSLARVLQPLLFVENPQIEIVQTEVETGMFGDAMDLVNRSDCWQMANTGKSKTSDVKKKIIFSVEQYAWMSGQYAWMSDKEKEIIMQTLEDLAEDGFEIYRLSPHGKLEKWDKHPIKSPGLLPELNTLKNIHEFCFQDKLRLSPGKVFVFNDVVVRKLLQLKSTSSTEEYLAQPVVINIQNTILSNHLAGLSLWLQRNPQDKKCLIVDVSEVKSMLPTTFDTDQLVINKIRSEDKVMPLSARVKKLTISYSDAEKMIEVLQAAPSIQELIINNINLNNIMQHLSKITLPFIKSITFSDCNTSVDDILKFISCAGAVDKVVIHNCKFQPNPPQREKPTENIVKKHLKELIISQNAFIKARIEPNTIRGLIQNYSIDSLEIPNITTTQSLNLAENSLSSVNHLTVKNNNPEFLENILKATTHLKSLSCNTFSPSLEVEFALFKHHDHLQTIHAIESDEFDFFLDLGELTHLVELKWNYVSKKSNTNVDRFTPPKQYAHIFNIERLDFTFNYERLLPFNKNSAPKLKHLTLHKIHEYSLFKLEPNTFPALRTLVMEDSKEINFEDLLALKKAAPLLKEIQGTLNFTAPEYKLTMDLEPITFVRSLNSFSNRNEDRFLNSFIELETLKLMNKGSASADHEALNETKQFWNPDYITHTFNKLRCLTIQSCEKSSYEYILKLMQHSPNLEEVVLTLSFIQYKNFIETMQKNSYYFPEITSLTINFTDHNQYRKPTTDELEPLGRMLSHFPNIKKLDGQLNKKADIFASLFREVTAKEVRQLGLQPEKESAVFAKLTDIQCQFSKCSITYKNLTEIKRAAPNLRPRILKQLIDRANVVEAENKKMNSEKADPKELMKALMQLAGDAKGEGESDGTLSEIMQSLAETSGELVALPQTATNSYLNTKHDEKKSLSFISYFPPIIDPSMYRLHASIPDMKGMDLTSNQLIENFKSISISNKLPETHQQQSIPGVRVIKAESGQAYKLPSLDANEIMSSIYVTDATGNVLPKAAYHLEYCNNTNFYRIVFHQACDVEVHFNINLPKYKSKLPDYLVALVKDYNTFDISYSDLTKKFANLMEFAEYIKEHRLGACRHRTIAAYHEITTNTNYPTRIIKNNVHEYIEVKVGNDWHALNLGGYPAELKEVPQKVSAPKSAESKYAEMKEVSEAKEEKKAEEITIATQPSASITMTEPATIKPVVQEQSLSQQLQTYLKNEKTSYDPKKRMLLLAESDQDLRMFYQTIGRYNKDDIFVAHRPEDISLIAKSMTHTGKLKENYTGLSRWFEKHKESKGLIIVDIRDFKPVEVARLNDLLDRRVEGQTIPSDLGILIIDRPNQFYGPDFIRRIPKENHKTLEPTTIELLPTSEEKIPAETLVIDLYESPYWQRFLAGLWQLVKIENSDKAGVTWREGKLLLALSSADNKPKHVIFDNPPMHDPNFTRFLAEIQGLKRLPWADRENDVPDDMPFTMQKHYRWNALRDNAKFTLLNQDDPPPYILSNGQILHFTQNPRYEFNTDTNQLDLQTCFIDLCEKKCPLKILCSPDTTEGTLAEVMTIAKQKNVKVEFCLTHSRADVDDTALAKLSLDIPLRDEKSTAWKPHIDLQIHEDVTYGVRAYTQTNPSTIALDISSLQLSDLGRHPTSTDTMREEFLSSGHISLLAPLAPLMDDLRNGKTILLYGDIPSQLYPALLKLSLGQLEGKPIKGKLVIMTTTQSAPFANWLQETTPVIPAPTLEQQKTLLKKIIPLAPDFDLKPKSSYMDNERQIKQMTLNALFEKQRAPIPPDASDQEKSAIFDANRLLKLYLAWQISPFVMAIGPTGTGKTTLLQQAFSTADNTIIVDEANFISELSGKPKNYLQRYLSLLNPNSGLLSDSQYTELKDQKVLFIYNPDSYGAGRSNEGILTDQALTVLFEPLPDFYVRTQLVPNTVVNTLKEKSLPINIVMRPIISMYNWLSSHSPPATQLITPREIKLILNLLLSEIKQRPKLDASELEILTQEIAYTVCKQTLHSAPELRGLFETHFRPTKHVLERLELPACFEPYQNQVYQQLQMIMRARKQMITDGNTDLGLGAFFVEGGSGIGKSYFVDQAKLQMEAQGTKVYEVSATTPPTVLVDTLKKAFNEGAILIANEFNTIVWPNKLLNNFLMGLDENGKRAITPGFFLIATQNPASFNRYEADPAIERRSYKVEAEWPLYQPKLALTLKTKVAPAVPEMKQEAVVAEPKTIQLSEQAKKGYKRLGQFQHQPQPDEHTLLHSPKKRF